MRIEGFIPKENLKLDYNFFNEGSIISGEIIEIFEDEILLDIKKLGLIKGKTDIPIDDLKGMNLKFFVKINEQNTIKLIPLLQENTNEFGIIKAKVNNDIIEDNNKSVHTRRNNISNILREYNIIEDKTTVEIIKTLFKFNVPIDKENVERSIKVLDKINYISNKLESEKVILLNNNIDPIKSDIIDFVLVEKKESPQKTDLNYIYNEIKSITSEGKTDSDFIKTIIFLLKNNMTVSVNNLKNLFNLMDNQEMISEKLIRTLINDFNETKTNKQIKTSEQINKKNLNIENKLDITFTEKDIYTLREYNEDIKQKLEMLQKFTKNIDFDENSKNNIKDLLDKIEFLNEMNKEMNFMYIPITIKGEKREGSISFFKKMKRSRKKSQRLKVFINLNMIYLGDIKIILESFDNFINISLNLDEQHLSFVKSYETKLYQIIEEQGYKLNALNYTTVKETSLLDIFSENDKSYYYLDVRV